MAMVCPQRIIAEAIRLLELLLVDDTELENRDNTVQELESLSKALWRDGVHRIEEVN
jgi:hypothetical protein